MKDMSVRSGAWRRWVLVLSISAAVALGAAIALLLAGSGDGTSGGSESGRPLGSAGVSEATGDHVVVPTAAPDDVSWHLVGQAAVPVSPTAGPSSVTGGTASGYAHTPAGALIAAVQLTTRAGLSAGRDVWEPTITGQFMPGPDRDRLLAALRAADDAPAAPGELSQLTGFRYVTYSPDTAVVDLFYRAPAVGAARYHVLTATLRWRDGDWRMVAPPGGAWTAINRPATDLTGVVEWGAR